MAKKTTYTSLTQLGAKTELPSEPSVKTLERVPNPHPRENYTVRCNYYDNTVYYGDRCAFRVLRATQTDAGLAEPAVRLYWDDALAWDEFDDFRHDAVGPTRLQAGTCLHATIRNVGDWPIEWRDSNWTFRDWTDSKCR